MAALGILLVIIVVAFAIGWSLLAWLRVRGDSFLEEFVFGTSIGLGIIAYLVLGLGLLGYLFRLHLILLLVVLAALGYRGLVRFARGLTGAMAAVRRLRGKTTAVALVIFIGLIWLFTLFGALAPAAGNDWDGLSYHLAVPKIHLQHHQITYIPWMSHSNFPFTWEMLYLLGLSLHDQALAKLFHYLAFILIGLTIFALGRRYANARTGLLAAAIFSSVPLVGWEATIAYNELPFALYALLALYAFLRWADGEDTKATRWFWVMAVAAGLGLGVKTLSGTVCIFLAGAVVWNLARTRRRPWGEVSLTLGKLVLVAGLVAAPWYLKSQLWTGNPVYPFLYGLFGGKYWSAAGAHEYRVNQLAFGLGHGPLAFLRLPWDLTMSSQAFFDNPSQPVLFATIGPLFLALLPTLFLGGRLPRGEKLLLLFSVTFLAFWFVTMQQVRYLIPVLPALSLVAAGAAGRASERVRALRPIMGMVIGVAFAASLGVVMLLTWGQIPVALGLETPGQYLERSRLPVYPVSRYINDYLPDDSKVIFFGETRGFYCDRAYMWANHHHEMIPYAEFRSADEMLAMFRGLGVTHVLMTETFHAATRDGEAPMARLMREALNEGRLRLLYLGLGERLYEVAPSSSPAG